MASKKSSRFISVPSRMIAPLLARFDQRWEKSALDLHDPEEPRSPVDVDGRAMPDPIEENVHGEGLAQQEEGGKGMDEKENEFPLVQPRKSPMPWDDTPHDGRRYGFQP